MIAFSPLSVSAEASLSERLAGYILLQVEGHGEAWYVNPTDNVRYYMKDGPTAYEMMREFGLGISEVDFATLEAGDEDIAERVAGHIVLRVEKHGEAYYINPADHSLTYLKDGEAAYGVMRAQSLGITDEDLSDVPSGTIESNISSIVLEDTETGSETVIIHEIIHQPIIVYVEQPEEVTEEVGVVEEPAMLPLWMKATGTSNYTYSSIVDEEPAYGVNSASNVEATGWIPGTGDFTDKHIFNIQPGTWTGNRPRVNIFVNLGNPYLSPETDLTPGFSCVKSGASFWDGSFTPVDISEDIDLSEWVDEFFVNKGAFDNWAETKDISVTCTTDDGNVFTDSLTLRLTSNINY